MLAERTQRYVEMYRRAAIDGTPADASEVQDIQKSLDVRFPAAYEAFLICFGHGFAPFEGSHHTIEDDLADMQRHAPRMMGDSPGIPGDAFVFFSHQKCAFYYFLPSDGDDPPVFQFLKLASDCKETPTTQLAQSFAAFLLDQPAS